MRGRQAEVPQTRQGSSRLSKGGKRCVTNIMTVIVIIWLCNPHQHHFNLRYIWYFTKVMKKNMLLKILRMGRTNEENGNYGDVRSFQFLSSADLLIVKISWFTDCFWYGEVLCDGAVVIVSGQIQQKIQWVLCLVAQWILLQQSFKSKFNTWLNRIYNLDDSVAVVSSTEMYFSLLRWTIYKG